MKKLFVEIEDDTRMELVEKIEIKHLSDLGCGIKEAVEDFVKWNGGIVMPPVSIKVTEKAAPQSPTGPEDSAEHP